LRFDPLDYIWNANLRGFSVCYLSCSTHWFALLHLIYTISYLQIFKAG